MRVSVKAFDLERINQYLGGGVRIEILYEDNHLLVVNKPAGVLTQSDQSGHPSLLDELKGLIKDRDNKPGNVYLGMVQRLDKPVSGVLFFAKTSKAASRLSKEIRERRAVKMYLAITEANPSAKNVGRWQEHSVNLIRRGAKTYVSGKKSEGQKGRIKDKVLYQDTTCAVHLVRLITGRKHQIRAQLSHLGWPIAGDAKYGSQLNHPEKAGIGLHALHGAIKHPVKEEIVQCTSPLPAFCQHYLSGEVLGSLVVQIQEELDQIKVD